METKSTRCQQCGDPIAPNRLKALPNAKLCVACANQREQDEDVRIRATDRRVMNALVQLSEYDQEMFAPEAHE